MKDKVMNCIIKSREGEAVFTIDKDRIHPNLDGYAIFPLEENPGWLEIMEAAEKAGRMEQQRDRLAEVEAAARIIFDATVIAPGRKCPHGIAPSYPTHAWWCDDCFGRLEAALGVQDAPMDRQEYLKRLHEQLAQDDSVQQ